MLDLIDQLLCTGHFEAPKVNLWIISLQRTFGIDSSLLILLSIQSTAILSHLTSSINHPTDTIQHKYAHNGE